MKRFVILLLVVVSTLSAVAQQQNACTLQSCHSFHELLNSKDEDILDELSHRNEEAYVCFRSDADSFFIARMQRPKDYDWFVEKQPTTEAANPFGPSDPPKPGEAGWYIAYASVSMAFFKDGQTDEWRGAVGPSVLWRTWGHFDTTKVSNRRGMPFITQEAPTLTAACAASPGENCGFDINSTAFNFSETYKNQRDTETEHDIDIRLSTARFSETYSWEKKSDTQTGRCEVYKEGKRIR